jgi:hypothetical protein
MGRLANPRSLTTSWSAQAQLSADVEARPHTESYDVAGEAPHDSRPPMR